MMPYASSFTTSSPPPNTSLIHIENKYRLLNNQVCVHVQQNILNAENKRDKIFVDEVELCEKKNHSEAAKPRNSTIQRQSKLQSTRTHKTYCSSHTFNYNTKPIVNASQPSLLLEGVFDGFLHLRDYP
jgi:hypothetical protein